MSDYLGKIVKGTVTGIKDFGAFIKLPDGKTGLCHISEVSHDYVKDIKNYIEEGQEVDVKVISIDGDKISLSMKKALPDDEKRRIQSKKREENFEDMMSDFLSNSSDKLKPFKKPQKARKRFDYKK